MTTLADLRTRIRQTHLAPQEEVLARLRAAHPVDEATRAAAVVRGTRLVEAIRADTAPGMMEVFLAEYGLSTEEGVALMCLAEALLRVPDADTIDALIEDKIAPSAWGSHLGHSSSSLVNASTWALMLTGKVLTEPADRGVASTLRRAVKRLGEPVIRTAVSRAMKEMGRQFVLGTSIENALERGKARVDQGYTYSYDMLGEAAMTSPDAETYFRAYSHAIEALAPHCTNADIRDNPGISIKLSALFPRYEEGQRDRVMEELVPRAQSLARAARKAGMGLNIDAEEADRLDLSLDVIEALLRDPELAGWDGFGVVVQAYGKRAAPVIDWLHALATGLDRRIMVRLVKGAYWDTEIKRAQVEGLTDFPVFTHKVATDVSYVSCAKKLLGLTDRIYPQFATHNAHTVAAILEMAPEGASYEFQRLHGMGAALHEQVRKAEGTRCRIYAPVGKHRDLLAYLVRRLLENGANSSFVNQIVDEDIPAAVVAADPFAALDRALGAGMPAVVAPAAIFGEGRLNARGYDLHDPVLLAELEAERAPFRTHAWQAGPLIAGEATGGEPVAALNPADHADTVGTVTPASAADVETALAAARPWAEAGPIERATVLRRAADLMERRFGEIFALLAREAGKTPADAVAELREAVDFLRFYGNEAARLDRPARGVFACISPWNFPLAIFCGQVSAALAAGNGVLAKPAEQTPLTAHLATAILLEAGVPRHALQLLPGDGAVVGAALTSDPRVAGVAFTGSTETAQAIHRAMAGALAPSAPLIAETGGLNAMIVDSSALPEQAVRDIVNSAFRSAGQRCSALRVLYVQKDVEATVLRMLYGAMAELRLGDPWALDTDVGPVIDAEARDGILAHVAQAEAEGRVLHRLNVPESGTFVAPTVIRVNGIADLEREIFGPVLHVASYRAEDLDAVVDAINATGYGLTFGMHSRIDDRVEQAVSRLNVGNIYINRNQIGAVVGSQPFGGEGLSGTGPKAGGPNYLPRFAVADMVQGHAPSGAEADPQKVAAALAALPRPARKAQSVADLPGPTGESNRLSVYARGRVLCLGPSAELARQQARIAEGRRCTALMVAPDLPQGDGVRGTLAPGALRDLQGFDVVAFWGPEAQAREIRKALAARKGAILPLSTGTTDLEAMCRLERHVCIDTTAAGGNVALLGAAAKAA
ncbi:bifunctional proline dehydrogenase/L-glutamate gamma-semialdehyde dehydrogenase PutA [Halovulum dunhuangense]|uniref:Bifunctional protein PutA n=1 Tax=Halovulum dunhuangense TaxID=1505036 RepID=A0A849L1T8_9RHOB|nr:bifunctional proline dehydrogenase/L-glutamate gamma-semialdehyde dehydrogenase PutA [Halovulum dunhuangense]NNU80201.1 bifunctional proline dehydrogenase/L-glutamate gamma-semialdehyde dehydrogenase PutA [Halovulum dunhuangense]